MALEIKILDYGDIELETSFLVLGHECGRIRRVPVGLATIRLDIREFETEYGIVGGPVRQVAVPAT